MGANFAIEYDSASKTWLPTQMRVRMLARDQNGQYNPCNFSNPEFICEPSGWLAFSPAQSGEIISAQVNVTEQFISSKLANKFSQPIKVTVKGIPPASSSEKPEPVSVDCSISVAEPGQNMGFTVSPADFWKDGEVWLPADGKSSCVLTIWVEEVDPATGQVYRAPDEDFDFKLESSFPPETLVSPDLDLGIVKPVSSWQTANSMPELRSSMQGKLMIKAFSKKKPGSGACGKLDIPMNLFPSKVIMKATYTPQLPAQPGQEITVRLLLLQEGRNLPLADTPVEFTWAKSCSSAALGKILSQKALTDSEGYVELSYAPPEELIYQAKKRYYDEICVSFGTDKNKTTLEETLVIPVMPLIKFSGSAEKKGLQMDPEQEPIEILPEQLNGGEIRGNLILPVTAAGEARKLFGVAKARLSLIYDGQDPGRPPVLTIKNGVWTIKLPELDEAMNKAKLPIKPLKLPVEPEKKQVILMIPGNEEEQIIKSYEEELAAKGLELFSTKFQRELKMYRYHFASQLASEDEQNYDLAISGVKLVQIAVRGSDAFFRRFKCHEDMVKSRFEGLLGSLINILLGTAKASALLRTAGTKIASGGKQAIELMVESRFGRWICKGASWLGSFASSIGQKALNHIAPLVRRLGSAAQSFINKIGTAGSKIAARVSSIIDDLIKSVDELATALVNKVDEFQKALADSSAHWNELVEWVQKKKNAVSGAVEEASTWITSLLEKLQGMFQAVIDMVGTLFTRLGKLLYNALSGILAWCTKTAQKWLGKALNWLCEHSEPVKKQVEDIVNKTMSREEFSENGIEGCIGAILNEIVGWVNSWQSTDDIKNLDLQDIKMKFAVLGRQPTQVVGYVYRAATRQQLPKDWESQRSAFTRKVVELNTSYHDYETVTASIDEVTDIVGMLISVGSLGVALLGIAFSGGMALAPAVEAMAVVDSAFNIAKAALCDIPQVSVAMFVMVALVIKYDLIITDIWLGSNSGATT